MLPDLTKPSCRTFTAAELEHVGKGDRLRWLLEIAMSHASDECLVWPFSISNKGYGEIRFDKHLFMVHRLAWLLLKGAILTKHGVLHSCDNPPCFNVRHLFLGTQADNMQDCSRKGRIQHGERGGATKLTTNQVLAIRTACAEGALTHDQIAAQYGVFRTCVTAIHNRRSWRHIP
jgi:hypothetical protein